MYEFTPSECQHRLAVLKNILAEGQQRGPDFVCQCGEAAKPVQGQLLARMHAGDVSGLDELLVFYRGCIDSWAKDICPTSAARSCFKAELVATLLTTESELTETNFCNQLHSISTQVAIAQHEYVLEWHNRSREVEAIALASVECLAKDFEEKLDSQCALLE